MKILVATDSFKNSLSATEASDVIGIAIRDAWPEAEVTLMPISDGGEGFLEILVRARGGELVGVDVHDPLGRKIQAEFGILQDGKTSIVEMAQASGIMLISNVEKNPLFCTTYGTGQMIKAALDKGCTRLLVGLGGSATIDGGLGMARALGARFFDDNGREVLTGGRGLRDVRRIDTESLDKRISETEVIALCDVDVPITGVRGTAKLFGAQKGATPAMANDLDKWLFHYAQLIYKSFNVDIINMPMAGASGGLAGALLVFLGAKLVKGIDFIADMLDLDSYIRAVDLVITGEGKIDAGTMSGKAISGVTRRAMRLGVPVVAVAGHIEDGLDETTLGLNAMMSACTRPMNPADSIRLARPLLRDVTRQMTLLIRIGQEALSDE